ncbi:MAG: T9SS type A sorting domain-containing protein [Ignavibacteriales bacterium]|nr:MAG: T9SS type A sorting domain-containing protein [Ignavibacteriales bacterium]
MTEIEFALPEQSDVTLKIYDILGKEIATLATGSYSAGRYTVPFDGSSHASGVYIYKLSYGKGQTISKKMTLLK